MNYKSFPILDQEVLLHVDGTADLQALKEQYPDPLNREEQRHPMAQYRVMLAIRQAVAREQRRHTLEQTAEISEKLDPRCGAAFRDLIQEALAEEFTTTINP